MKKYYRIRYNPEDKYYFNMYLFDTADESYQHYTRITGNTNFPKYQLFVCRNIKNNRLGQMYLNHEYLTYLGLMHEIQHMIVAYLRNYSMRGNDIQDFIIKYRTNKEEKLTYSFEYILEQINDKIDVRGLPFNTIIGKKMNTGKDYYERGKAFYKWDLRSI